VITLHDVEQGSPTWFKLREGKYTGSGAYKLLTRPKQDYFLDEDKDFKGNFFTERGHLLEPEAIHLFERIKKIDVLKIGFVTNDKYPDCGYSPDGLLSNAVIEVKSFMKPNHTELLKAQAETLPLKILAQVHFGMMICELPVAYLIAYNPKMQEVKDRLKIIEIKQKKSIINNFKRILE